MMTTKTLEQLLKENKISQRTYDKVILSKQYIERKYNLKSQNNMELKNFFSQLNLYNVNQSKLNIIKKEIYEKQTENYRKLREKQSIREYESLSIIGRGAFGEVHVCRKIKTGEIVAIKKIKKNGVLSTPDIFMKNIDTEDIFVVIASDGVWDVVEENEILKMSQGSISSNDFSKKIINLAKERDTHDNISCIVIKLNKNN